MTRPTSGQETGSFVSSSPDQRPSSDKRLERLACYWVEQYGGEGNRFSPEQERLLSRLIQAGIAESEKDADIRNDAVIAEGETARQALFEANLAFAHYMARESVGIHHAGSTRKRMDAQRRWIEQDETDPLAIEQRMARRRRSAGTYVPISTLRSPLASLEDRYARAEWGLWEATARFLPERPGKPVAKFVTYAAWGVQVAIDKGTSYDEHSGIRLPVGANKSIRRYFGDHLSLAPDETVPDDIARMIDQLKQPPFPDELEGFEPGSVEDSLYDEDDDVARTFAEVCADPYGIEPEAEFDPSVDYLRERLDRLSERQAGIIALRYGLREAGSDSLPHFMTGSKTDGSTLQVEPIEPHTLNEIGRVYGITAGRVRQIEGQVMSVLRRPPLGKRVQLNDLVMGDRHLAASDIWRGDAVRVPHARSSHQAIPHYTVETRTTPSEDDIQAAERLKEARRWAEMDKAWQAHPDDAWEDEVRTDRRELNDEEIGALATILDAIPYWYFTDAPGGPSRNAPPIPLPGFYEVVMGKTLSPNTMNRLWQYFMDTTYRRLADSARGDFNPDTVGKLFSQLIDRYIESPDVPVELHIPDHASGKIGFLASNLGLAHVEIYGNPGSNVAAWNRGDSSVIVHGDTGANAGAFMEGDSQLFVYGLAGVNCGVGARENAQIACEVASSVGKHDATVLVGDTLR